MTYSAQLTEKRDAELASADALIAVATAESRALSADEDKTIATSLDTVRDLDEQITRHAELEARSLAAHATRKALGVDAVVTATVVKSEQRTYSKTSGNSFVTDAFAAYAGSDFGAQERLNRHMVEERVERRDVGTGAFAGLVVPQFLTDLVAPFARAGRPLADRARRLPLPDSGMTLSISKVTTGSAVAEQTEGDAVQETDIDDTKLDVSVKTVAGQQNVSRQALERGTNIDSLVFADLVSAYHTKVDALLNVELLASAGQSIAYTDASPTVAELYPKLLGLVSQVQTTFFAGPNAIVMHPRRLAFILAAVDSTGRPLAVPAPFAQNPIAAGDGGVVYGNSGYTIAGFPVITDANISVIEGAGTNQDTIFVGSLQELLLFEQGGGEPMFLRFEQPKSSELEVKMVVYGYVAMTANRYPNAWGRVTGTGLITPTF